MARSIDSLYERAVHKLTADGVVLAVSRKLISLDTNTERTRYVREILEKFKYLPENLKVSKSENLSNKYREIGNECFKKSQDYEALQYYNLALLHAPPSSTQQSLAFANRSAVHFHLKHYEECSKDIETVFNSKYPEKLQSKLLNRQKQCCDIESVTQDDRFDKDIQCVLTSMPNHNPRYICATSKVEVKNNKMMGRHVVAMDDIKVGEIIAVENPYVSLILKPQTLFSCAYCFSRSGNLLPCEHCCFVLYCSETCKTQAFHEYHSIECPLMATLTMMEFTKLELLALRIVIKARCELSDWTSLLDLIEELDSTAGTEYQGHVQVGAARIYDSKYYNSIHTLATNVERRSMSDLFQKSVTAAVFLHLLNFTDFFNEDDAKVKERAVECVGGLLLQHIMTSPTNMHNVSATIESETGRFTCGAELGSAAYAFLSLINHSCAPNVVRFNRLGSAHTTLVALRPIKKGMQLFDNYGSHHALQCKQERQESLKFQYKFDCACEACIRDWPLYFSLPRAKNLPVSSRFLKENVLDPDTVEDLQKGNLDIALKKFRPLCEVATILESYAPCVELADCQEAMKQCLFIVHGTLTHGFSRVLNWEDIVAKNNA